MLDYKKIKAISIIDFLARIGVRPISKGQMNNLYQAPYRQDSHPSFIVNKSKNRWYDLAQCKGGDILDLVKLIYNIDDNVKAVHKLEACTALQIKQSEISTSRINSSNGFYDIIELPLTTVPLLSYLSSRGIDRSTAEKYCVEIRYKHGMKKYFALGFKNMRNGYEARNLYFKGCIGPKDISLIHHECGNKECVLFEGFMDFLSYIVINKQNQHLKSYIVLNSVANLSRALPFLGQFDILKCYFDNDDAGNNAYEEIKKHFKIVINGSDEYPEYKDLNEYLVKIRTKEKKGNQNKQQN